MVDGAGANSITARIHAGDVQLKKKTMPKDNQPPSRREAMKVVRYMGATEARLTMPLLHPDHIKYAAIVLRQLADQFDEISSRRDRNFNKIFDARVCVSAANDDLGAYARDDIQYVHRQSRLKHYRSKTSKK